MDKAEAARLDEQEKRKSLTSHSPRRSNENDENTVKFPNLHPTPHEPKNLRELKQISKYPDGFPLIGDAVVLGYTLRQTDWENLSPNVRINDEVLNSFMALIQYYNEKNNFNALSFSTFFAQQIFQSGDVRRGTHRWAQKAKVENYPLWLVSVNSANGSHWSLLVVNFEHECMVYVDSMHWGPYKGSGDNGLIPGVMKFIASHFTGKKKIDFTKWKLYVPNDIPLQVSSDGSTYDNCGVHVMTWAYIISTSSYEPFSEADMPNIRKGIAHLLLGAHTNNLKLKALDRLMTEIWDLSESKKKPRLSCPSMTTRLLPPLSSDSTLEYFSSLKLMMTMDHRYSIRGKSSN